MLQIKTDSGNDRVNSFIENLKTIKWLKPDKNLKKEDIEKQINITLECFWVKAWIEYRELKTQEDYRSARDAARGVTRSVAWDAASRAAWDISRDDAAMSAAWDAASSAAWDISRDDAARSAAAMSAAWDAVRVAAELSIIDTKEFKSKYPNWAFTQYFKLWEMWLYPIGAVDQKFIIYIPTK